MKIKLDPVLMTPHKLSFLTLLLAGMLLSPLAAADTRATPSDPSVQAASDEANNGQSGADDSALKKTDDEPREQDATSPNEPKPALERNKEYVDSQVRRASQWVDGFFDDPTNEEEATSTQFRIRPELFYREEQGTKFRLKASVKIRIPGLGDKVSFVAGDDDMNDDSNNVESEAEDESIVGFQFFLSDSVKWNTSITAGVKFNSFAGIIGPRIRYQTGLGDKSSLRLTQTLRWQTNNYWEIGSRADLNFVLSDRLYFRQTVFGRWRGEESDEKGYRTRVSSVLSQKLSSSVGLQYDFTTVVHTEPDTHVDKYTVALRYRKRTQYDWMYYEIVPQISFEDEFDYKFNPGIRLRLELFFGGSKTQDFWKRTFEDDEEFRW